MSFTVIRSHEICAGHRVVGHESKCRHLHGHNYVFHFHVAPKSTTVAQPTGRAMKVPGQGYKPTYRNVKVAASLDDVGRVIDFSVVKTTLCHWLEDNWDHKFLHWDQDTLICALELGVRDFNNNRALLDQDTKDLVNSLVALPFNPTAENLAAYMVEVIGPRLLDEYGVELVECRIEETSKCHVGYTK